MKDPLPGERTTSAAHPRGRHPDRPDHVDRMLKYREARQSEFLRDDRHRRGRCPADEDPGWDDAVRAVEGDDEEVS